MGDYILSQTDLVEMRHFDDAVAFGGWPIDEHCPGGIRSPHYPPTWFHHHFKEPYEIPFRCLYSRTIDNLLFAGRNISQTHIALASTRVMATGAVMGQAAGTAAALSVKHAVTPRELCKSHINELQEQLLLDDAYIPHRPARGADDLARQAVLSASSTSSGSVDRLIDGVSRDLDGETHHWESDGLEAAVELQWSEPVGVSEVILKLDTDLASRLWKVMKQKPVGSQDIDPVPPRLIKRLAVEVQIDNTWTPVSRADAIRTRLVKLSFETIRTVRLRIVFHETYGHPHARLFEVRCY